MRAEGVILKTLKNYMGKHASHRTFPSNDFDKSRSLESVVFECARRTMSPHNLQIDMADTLLLQNMLEVILKTYDLFKREDERVVLICVCY